MTVDSMESLLTMPMIVLKKDQQTYSNFKKYGKLSVLTQVLIIIDNFAIRCVNNEKRRKEENINTLSNVVGKANPRSLWNKPLHQN
jgi:hypothetical protein